MDVYETFLKYASMLMELPYSVGRSPRLMMQHDGRVYSTAAKSNFAALTPDDIIDVTDANLIEKDLILESKTFSAILISKTPYAGICLDSNREIHAVLDDMASIVGETVKLVPHRKIPMRMALKKSDAVMVEHGAIITTGRTMYEAVVCLTVLEKSAEVILKSPVIGGAKRLGHFDAKKLRSFYKKKYSKKEEEHKNAAEG